MMILLAGIDVIEDRATLRISCIDVVEVGEEVLNFLKIVRGIERRRKQNTVEQAIPPLVIFPRDVATYIYELLQDRWSRFESVLTGFQPKTITLTKVLEV